MPNKQSGLVGEVWKRLSMFPQTEETAQEITAQVKLQRINKIVSSAFGVNRRKSSKKRRFQFHMMVDSLKLILLSDLKNK